MHKKLTLCCVLLLGWALAASCAYGGEKLQVVVTIYPLADMAANVGGDLAEVKVLLPPGANPHTFEPRPSQIAEISRALVFVKVGVGIDFWADKFAAAASRKSLRTVDCSQGIDLLGDDDKHEKETQGEGRGEHKNPHFWLDPISAVKMVDSIAEAMAKADPENADNYLENAGAYKEKLKVLDAAIKSAVAGFEKKEFVAFHSAWVYFARRYGLRQAAVIEPFPGKEPSPRHLARVVKEARRIGAKAIFAEPQLNPKAALVLAKEAGIKVLYLDPIGGPNLPNRSNYLDLMRYNLSIFKEALDG